MEDLKNLIPRLKSRNFEYNGLAFVTTVKLNGNQSIDLLTSTDYGKDDEFLAQALASMLMRMASLFEENRLRFAKYIQKELRLRGMNNIKVGEMETIPIFMAIHRSKDDKSIIDTLSFGIRLGNGFKDSLLDPDFVERDTCYVVKTDEDCRTLELTIQNP